MRGAPGENITAKRSCVESPPKDTQYIYTHICSLTFFSPRLFSTCALFLLTDFSGGGGGGGAKLNLKNEPLAEKVAKHLSPQDFCSVFHLFSIFLCCIKMVENMNYKLPPLPSPRPPSQVLRGLRFTSGPRSRRPIESETRICRGTSGG